MSLLSGDKLGLLAVGGLALAGGRRGGRSIQDPRSAGQPQELELHRLRAELRRVLDPRERGVMVHIGDFSPSFPEWAKQARPDADEYLWHLAREAFVADLENMALDLVDQERHKYRWSREEIDLPGDGRAVIFLDNGTMARLEDVIHEWPGDRSRPARRRITGFVELDPEFEEEVQGAISDAKDQISAANELRVKVRELVRSTYDWWESDEAIRETFDLGRDDVARLKRQAKIQGAIQNQARFVRSRGRTRKRMTGGKGKRKR